MSNRIIYLMECFVRGGTASPAQPYLECRALVDEVAGANLADCSQTNQEEPFGWINRCCDHNSFSSADSDLR